VIWLDSLIDRHFIRIFAILWALIIVGLVSCYGPPPAPARIVPPAAVEVADLSEREHAASLAAAEAAAKGDTAAADYHRRLADELAALRSQAESRQRDQQRELEAIAARERTAARADALADQLAKDRRWAGIAIGACVAAAVALLLLRIPPLLAIGGPGAAAAGLLWIAAWSSVPWLAWALGLALACLLLLGVAGLAVYAVAQWRRHADLAERFGRTEADRISLYSQPAFLRWLVSCLLTATR
jgi:ElaB/YqjD/DUF883 family membrane-anchored ribosome-binding protein